MNIHTTGPSPAIPIQQGLKCLLAFSHAKKCDYNYLHPQMTLWLFSHSRIRFKNGLPCFLQPFVAPFQFLSQTLFFSASFSASSSQLQAQLPLSCSINLPLLMSLFMCHLNWPALSHYLLGSVSDIYGENFFFTYYFLTPFYSFLNLVTELTLQTQGKIECPHFATIKFCLLCLALQRPKQYPAPEKQHMFVE